MRLYRYVTMKAALSTIRVGMWRLGKIKDFNDPFDCLFAFTHKGLSAPLDFFSPFSQRFRLEEFSKYGILCFSRKATTPAMWAHYAEGMKGVCFECEMPESESLYKVKYGDHRMTFEVSDENYLGSQECRNHVIQIIEHKHSSWQYEQEQRIFMKLGEGAIVTRAPRRSAYGQEPSHWIPIDEGVIQRLIVGPMATEGDVSLLKTLLEKTAFKAVPVVRAKIHPILYSVES